MIVETDKQSGFCFGVSNAVEIAEKALNEGEKVYCLGSIVHNDEEVNRLSGLGLETINHDEFRKLRNCKVLIRAHGEPPATYKTAEENNITIIEATCPIVKRLQARIREAWQKTSEQNGQIVIFGKKGHAEVVGLMGQINNEAILVSQLSDLESIDVTRPVTMFAQTTMGITPYNEIAEALRQKMRDKGTANPDELLKVSRTICGQVSNREPHLREFAARYDVIIFVSGRESSNGKMLYSVCKSINPETYFVSSTSEIDREWFRNRQSAGICGATSTPKWLIEQIRDHVSNL